MHSNWDKEKSPQTNTLTGTCKIAIRRSNTHTHTHTQISIHAWRLTMDIYERASAIVFGKGDWNGKRVCVYVSA